MTETLTSHNARAATMIIATVMVGAVVWWLRAILAPLALALFLMVIIDGLARVMEHRLPFIPRRATLALSLVLTTLVFVLTAYEVTTHASSFLTQLIAYAPQINGLVQSLGQELVDGGREAHAQLLAQALDQTVDLWRDPQQLGQEGRGVGRHLIGGDGEDQGGQSQRQAEARLAGDEAKPVLQDPGQPIDDDHQEEGDGQGRQDGAQPPDDHADHHRGDDHGGRAGAVAGQGLGHRILR